MGAKSSLTRMRNPDQLVAIRKLARALLNEARSLEVEQDHSAEPGGGCESEGGFYEAVKAYETFLIRRALLKAHGNQTLAARLLGLKTTTLHNKMKGYDIKADPKATEGGNGVAAGGCSDPCTRPLGAS